MATCLGHLVKLSCPLQNLLKSFRISLLKFRKSLDARNNGPAVGDLVFLCEFFEYRPDQFWEVWD